MAYVSSAELEQKLPYILSAPADRGTLKMIVVRPKTDERKRLESCDLSLAGGVHGDNWADGCWKSLPDGSPHPDVQVAIMNYRVMEAIEEVFDRRALAGDNLYVDLDLSEANLSAGQRLGIGSVVLEITATPHNGCKKFLNRFGESALKFVNSPQGKSHHLRGIYARVVQDGTVAVGDRVQKV